MKRHRSYFSTRLDLLKPNVENQVRDSQMKRAFSSDKGKEMEFQVGQSVITRDYRTKDKKIHVGNDQEKAQSERESLN